MMALWRKCILSLCMFNSLLRFAISDVYMHNPRGSNNRLDEANRERNNGNRLFDSQNNNRGGYNVGSVFYYVGSKLEIEWTNQHGCGGNPNLECEIILQYMCDDETTTDPGILRDGTVTTTIPINDEDADLEYGRHESEDYYNWCTTRERNKGLFTASQNLKGNSAKYTRQNPGGTRRGLECPEERDYYPYWHPTPWRDIAVLTDNLERCEYYQRESQNVKGKGQCEGPNGELIKEPNTAEACAAVTEVDATWVDRGAWGIPPPECISGQWTRDNHLGNTLNGETPRYNWTIPEFAVGEQCALRLRYNISTGDYDGWDPNINSTLNDQDGKKLNLAASLGYEADFKNNPDVDFGLGVEFELAVNTAQFGRTFQDRSHRVAFRNLPEGLEHAKVHNLNVRGHRGNIVQVYPSVEYDFTPNTLSVSTSDLVHIQWTGSNTNPRNNDGQGLAGTDRSNIVPIEDMLNNVPDRFDESPSWFKDVEAQVHGIGDATESSLGPMSGSDLAHFLSLASPTQMGGELSELDDMSPHYNGGLVRLFAKGQYRYMCSRNNNFSNRSQKGKLIANLIESASKMLDTYGGEIWTSSTGAGLKVPEGRMYQQKGQSSWQTALSIEIMELGNESSAGEAPAVAPENVENPGAVPGDVQAVQGVGKAFGYLPHGTTFSDNVTLMLTYTEEELQALRDDSDGKHQLLAFARTDDTDDQTWEVLEGGTFVDGTASIDITGFSVYSLVIVTYTKKNALDGYAVAMLVVGIVLLVSAALLAVAVSRGKNAHENLPEDEQELLFRSPKKPQSHSFSVASLLQSVTGKKPDPPVRPSRMTPALSAVNKLRAASIGEDSSLRDAAVVVTAQTDSETGSVL